MPVLAAFAAIAMTLAIISLKQGNYLARRLIEVEAELAKLKAAK
jgi:hypothetical protein